MVVQPTYSFFSLRNVKKKDKKSPNLLGGSSEENVSCTRENCCHTPCLS